MAGYDMYQTQVLDHYRNPRNRGALEKADIKFREGNPLCGDELEFHLALDGRGKVTDVRFDGHGCAISVSSASLLSQNIKGMNIRDVVKLTKDDILKMLGVPLSPTRVKCALLPLEIVIKGIVEHERKR